MSAGPRRLGRSLAICVGLVLPVFGYAWLIEPNWLEVTRQEVSFPNLPPEFDNLSIAHLSDLHIGHYGLRERRVVKLVAEAKPDLIAITGDVISKGDDHTPSQQFLKDLQGLNPPFGLWAVPGNHEHSDMTEDGDAMKRFFNAAGIALLVNEWGRIGRGLDTITIIGVDDAYSGHARWDRALADIRRTPFALLLTHSPEIFAKADMSRIDLVLAGHTHGGQVRLPWIGPLWLPDGSERYASGWFSGTNARMYVTRGIGMSFLPLRFLCRPEITFIRLKHAGN